MPANVDNQVILVSIQLTSKKASNSISNLRSHGAAFFSWMKRMSFLRREKRMISHGTLWSPVSAS